MVKVVESSELVEIGKVLQKEWSLYPWEVSKVLEEFFGEVGKCG